MWIIVSLVIVLGVSYLIQHSWSSETGYLNGMRRRWNKRAANVSVVVVEPEPAASSTPAPQRPCPPCDVARQRKLEAREPAGPPRTIASSQASAVDAAGPVNDDGSVDAAGTVTEESKTGPAPTQATQSTQPAALEPLTVTGEGTRQTDQTADDAQRTTKTSSSKSKREEGLERLQALTSDIKYPITCENIKAFCKQYFELRLECSVNRADLERLFKLAVPSLLNQLQFYIKFRQCMGDPNEILRDPEPVG